MAHHLLNLGSLGLEEARRNMHDQMGEMVRRLRSKLGLTQEELAHELGITVGTVNRWENGRFRPSKLARSTILEFAKKHGVSLEDELTSAATSQVARPHSSVN
jgi:DNA-binding transcriptional regulator YiaG